jgi:putative ABC transport system ATP-binding protein
MTTQVRRSDGPLEVSGVVVRYGDHVALDLPAMSVPPGTMVAVTGSSGSGKSTLLWVLAGALRPAAGSVDVGGDTLTGREQASRLGVALMPQGGALVSTLTAEENVAVGLLTHGSDPGDVPDRAAAALRAVGLDDEGGHLPEELSGGQQQRAAIAVLLALRARVLLLDEPTSELDAVNRKRILATLRAEADAGAVVVVATHDPEAAAPADAELRLDEGVGSWVRPLA